MASIRSATSLGEEIFTRSACERANRLPNSKAATSWAALAEPIRLLLIQIVWDGFLPSFLDHYYTAAEYFVHRVAIAVVPL